VAREKWGSRTLRDGGKPVRCTATYCTSKLQLAVQSLTHCAALRSRHRRTFLEQHVATKIEEYLPFSRREFAMRTSGYTQTTRSIQFVGPNLSVTTLCALITWKKILYRANWLTNGLSTHALPGWKPLFQCKKNSVHYCTACQG
jgi:hypothetical protein